MPYGLGLVNTSASHTHEPEHMVRRPGAQPLIKAATPQLCFLGGTYNRLHSSRAWAHIRTIVCCFFLVLSLQSNSGYSTHPVTEN